jgi:tight adherence protein C
MTGLSWLLLFFAAMMLTLVAVYRFLLQGINRQHAVARMQGTDHRAVETLSERLEDRSWLAQWLFVAGFRDPRAATTFTVLTLLLSLTGLALAFAVDAGGLTQQAVRSVSLIPGGVADLLVPVIYLMPWAWAGVVGCAPWLAVRSSRQRRVRRIEQDLPVTLELLATLSEAGLGFDAALDRVLQSQPVPGPLTEELRGFQADVLASRPRVECFRRLAKRAQISSLTVFISAVVQAEQIGAGVASVLRRQADDLRERRREDAMAIAMALPVKQLFPMAICFMPGIFVFTLGPTFFEFFRFAETFMRR